MKEPKWMLQDDGWNKTRWWILGISVFFLLLTWIVQIFGIVA